MNLHLKIPPVLQAVIAIFFIWLLNRYFPIYQVNVASQKILAAALMSAGALVSLSGVYAFKRSKTTVDPRTPEKANTLVAVGIYNYSRNPMYLGILLVLIGLCIRLGTLSTIFVLIAFVMFINKHQIIPEETALKKKFGENYIQYTQSVRRWL